MKDRNNLSLFLKSSCNVIIMVIKLYKQIKMKCTKHGKRNIDDKKSQHSFKDEINANIIRVRDAQIYMPIG
jgi:hypothetical protein